MVWRFEHLESYRESARTDDIGTAYQHDECVIQELHMNMKEKYPKVQENRDITETKCYVTRRLR